MSVTEAVPPAFPGQSVGSSTPKESSLLRTSLLPVKHQGRHHDFFLDSLPPCPWKDSLYPNKIPGQQVPFI